MWLWRDASPWLAILVVRHNGPGATRLRYVEQAAQQLARDWPITEGIQTAALAHFGDSSEWPIIKEVLRYWLSGGSLHTVVYETYLPGQRAAEPWDE